MVPQFYYEVRLKLFTFLLAPIFCFSHCIVFVHIGQSLPRHLLASVSQARIFNPDCPIYLITNEENVSLSYQLLFNKNVKPIACESLQMSEAHRAFKTQEKHEISMSGFWIYTSERFLYLDEFVSQYQLEDVFHLESDVMLYEDLGVLLRVLHKNYQGQIAATFEADDRCVPGFMYIPHPKPLQLLAREFIGPASMKNSDMEVLARFKDKYFKGSIDFLPIITPDYFVHHGWDLVKAKKTSYYSNHLDEFDSIFDGAALGVYLAGWDSRFHEECHPGEIDPHCVFNASLVDIIWGKDEKGRKVPYLQYLGRKWKINNLHITNKSKIRDFLS